MEGALHADIKPPPPVQRLKMALQRFEDSLVRHTAGRAVFLVFFLALYWLRVWTCGRGFYVVSYALGIYLLKLLVLFVQPLQDPNIEEPAPSLDDEHRPFVRKMPEFRVWKNAVQAIGLALFATFFPFLDIHVYAPILLVYFIIVFAVTAKDRIAHMWKHKYVPFTVGKKRYTGGSKPHIREYEK